MDLKEEHLLGEQGVAAHWYYRAKRAALFKVAKDIPVTEVLDVGAGSGFFSRALLEASAARVATCVDPGYPGDRDAVVAGKPLHFRREVNASSADLVLMMDVIEHVPDDVALVREYFEKVEAGTHFIVTVPAFQWLWSGHDVFLEHYRRYTLAQLESTLRAAGLRIESSHYFYGSVLPLVAGVRFGKKLLNRGAAPGSDMRRESAFTNRLLFEVSRLETLAMKLNRIGGTTVFARAVKD